ncbi:MAG: hypothetical protein AAF334_02720 [Pseudomonadota bacterium]
MSLADVAQAACYPMKHGRCERYWIMQAELARARAIGGYNDPITAIGNLLSGQATGRDIQPPITTIEEAIEWLPGDKYLDTAGALRPEWRRLAD